MVTIYFGKKRELRMPKSTRQRSGTLWEGAVLTGRQSVEQALAEAERKARLLRGRGEERGWKGRI
jgi:hypothetical protein